jgi:hypothetical protein
MPTNDPATTTLVREYMFNGQLSIGDGLVVIDEGVDT